MPLTCPYCKGFFSFFSFLLQRFEPYIKKLKVTRKKALAKHPELLKVLKNHTRARDYMIQIVKNPLCTPHMVCACKACELGLFQPLRMPIIAYHEIHNTLFPLPIPQARPRDDSGILHYMPLEKSLAMPFTDEHQRSKMSKVAATST
jgi:hypothetical protein